MKKKLGIILMTAVLVLTTGCAQLSKLESGEEIIATVDGYNVTAENLYEKMKNKVGANYLVTIIDEYIAGIEQKDSDEINNYAKNRITELKEQYTSYGYDWNEVLSGSGYKSEDELLADLIIDRKKTLVAENYVKDNLKEDEIKDYYEKNISATITAQHILIEGDSEESLNKVNDVINKLNNNEISWEDAVKTYSADTATKDSLGQLPDFDITDITEKYGSDFWNAVNTLEDNQWTKEPVKTEYGYHIIMKKSATERPSLEDSLDEIKTELCNKKFEEDSELTAKTWVKVREKYNTAIADTKLKEDYEAGIAGYKD